MINNARYGRLLFNKNGLLGFKGSSTELSFSITGIGKK